MFGHISKITAYFFVNDNNVSGPCHIENLPLSQKRPAMDLNQLGVIIIFSHYGLQVCHTEERK